VWKDDEEPFGFSPTLLREELADRSFSLLPADSTIFFSGLIFWPAEFHASRRARPSSPAAKKGRDPSPFNVRAGPPPSQAQKKKSLVLQRKPRKRRLPPFARVFFYFSTLGGPFCGGGFSFLAARDASGGFPSFCPPTNGGKLGLGQEGFLALACYENFFSPITGFLSAQADSFLGELFFFSFVQSHMMPREKNYYLAFSKNTP